MSQCPKCGCEIESPFNGRTVIHNVSACGSFAAPTGSVQTVPSLCEIRHGIGLCDDCGKPKWPQRYMGYGCMVCLDCIAATESEALNAPHELRRDENQQPKE